MNTNAQVAFFESCLQTKGGINRPLFDLLEEILSGKWAAEIAHLRSLEYKSPEYQKLKRLLPCFMVSATTRTGGHKETDIAGHSGFLQIDVDGLTAVEAISLRDRQAQDSHIFAAWLSPSGKGVKAVLCIPAVLSAHRRAFDEAAAYIRENYAVEIDNQCSDPCRLCFVSDDPGLKLNLNAVPLPVASPDEQSGCIRVVDAYSEPSDASTTRIENPADLGRRKKAQLAKLYDEFVAKVWVPRPAQRNEFIRKAIPFLFQAMTEEAVMAMAMRFYDDNRQLWKAGREEHEYASRSHLENCKARFLVGLSTVEIAKYGTLRTEAQRAAFRLSRHLSRHESPARDDCDGDQFFRSYDDLAMVLLVRPFAAWKIMRALGKRGIVQLVRNGQRRMPGMRGRATVWRYRLHSGATAQNSVKALRV